MKSTAVILLASVATAVSATQWTVDHPEPVVWTEEMGEFEDALLANAETTVPLHNHHPNLHKRDDGSVNLQYLEENLKLTSLKIANNINRIKTNGGLNANPDTRLKKVRRQALIPLNLPYDGTWTANIQIGTPAQSFNVYLDSGSSDLTVAAVGCTNCVNTQARYNPKGSSTATDTGNTFTSSFVDGTSSTARGWKDTVSLGGFSANQVVLAATTLSATLARLPIDGIMGMAFPNLAALKNPTLPFNLHQNGGAGQWFTLRLSDTAGLSYMSMGTIIKNRVIQPLYSYGVYVDQAAPTYWQVRLSAPNVNGNVAVTTRATHIIDSGTNYIIAPPSAAAEFWSNVPGAKQYNSNFYTFPCNNPPTVSITLFRRPISFGIAPDDFNLGYLPEDETRCVGGVVALNSGIGSSWILGQVFMKSWLTAFNMDTPSINIVKYRDRGTVVATGPNGYGSSK